MKFIKNFQPCTCLRVCFQGGTGRPGVTNSEQDARLFQVRGTDEMNTKATEVVAKASSLNSNDVFLLKTLRVCYLWYGKVRSHEKNPETELSESRNVAAFVDFWVFFVLFSRAAAGMRE